MESLIQSQINEQKLENKIYIIKDKTLLAPGNWNGKLYSSEEIDKSFLNTDWEDKDVISLIADHNDDDKKGRPLTIRDWLGFISNPRIKEIDGEKHLIGDLNICDNDLALKLEMGAPFGISPFLGGLDDGGKMKEIHYKNFAIVVEPACKKSFINLSDDDLNTKLEDLSMEERIKKRMNILEESSKLEETKQSDMVGSVITSEGLQKVEIKNELDSIELKGGNKMAENETQVTENLEEVKEVEVELSEDELLSEIAKLAEKYLSKKKVLPEEKKMQDMEAEIVSLKNELKIIKEEKEKMAEEKLIKEELSKQKLSANPKTIARTRPSFEGFTFGGSKSFAGSSEFAAILGY